MNLFLLKKKGTLVACLSFAVLSFFSVKLVISDTSTHAVTQTASQTVGPNTISMSNSDSVAIAIVPTSEQTVYTGTNTLSITNSCPSGATITLTTNSNSDTALSNKLIRSGSDSLSKEINPTTGSSLANNSWGYSINGGTNYYAVPAKDESPATVYDSTSATSSADSINVQYGIKMNNDLPSGNYSNDVIYTVAVKPACLSYTLIWDLGGGIGKTGADYSDTQIAYGSNINLTNYTPTKDGYTFDGWTNGSDIFTGSETSVDVNENNNRIITLRAKWVQNAPDVFSYTGNTQTWTASLTGRYKVELWGASGNGGAAGAYVSGTLDIKSGSVFYIYVGQQGFIVRGGANSASPAYNGGGVSGSQCQTSTTYGGYNMGGGGTDIRVISGAWNNAASLNSRIMVAAGGAGNGQPSSDGAGGGLIGYDGIHRNSYYGTGATQTSGGSINGSFGKGGNGQNNNDSCNYDSSGGGGGGWYGGGGSRTNGSNTWSQGGGGSSYISGHTGAVGITSTTSNPPKSGCSTGSTSIACSLTPFINPATNTYYTFTDTTMIDGGGYKWTNIKGALSAMPNPSGGNYSSGTGHVGNGYARITYVGVSI